MVPAVHVEQALEAALGPHPHRLSGLLKQAVLLFDSSNHNRAGEPHSSKRRVRDEDVLQAESVNRAGEKRPCVTESKTVEPAPQLTRAFGAVGHACDLARFAKVLLENSRKLCCENLRLP